MSFTDINRHRLGQSNLSRIAIHCVLVLLSAITTLVFAQPAPADAPVTRGMYNWIHSTRDAELAFAFYERVFGFILAHSTFAEPSIDAPPPSIRAKGRAVSDPLVWDLTNTHGSRFRTVFMEAENLSFGHELSEFFDIPVDYRPAQPWDTGASALVLYVRHFDTVVARLRAFGAPAITPGGIPVASTQGRTLLVRDPDGYLVQVIEVPGIAREREDSDVVMKAAIRITVADSSRSLMFYRDLLGFEAEGEVSLPTADLAVFGLETGNVTETVTRIQGTEVAVILTEFSLPANAGVTVHEYQWRLQDVGAPQFQLQVAGLDALLEETQAGGYRFLSVEGRPIQRPFGRFVFAIDPDGVLVEFVEPEQP